MIPGVPSRGFWRPWMLGKIDPWQMGDMSLTEIAAIGKYNSDGGYTAVGL